MARSQNFSNFRQGRRKSELRFCAGSNPARGVSEIRDGEDLWQWSRLKIRLKAFRRSTIPQKPFIIIIKVQRYAITWFLIFNGGQLTKVLLLFSRNLSVGPVFMTQSVFQSLLVDLHLDATIVSENVLQRSSIDAIIYNCGPLIWCFSCFRRLFQLVLDSAYNQTFKLSFTVVFARMVHNDMIFRRSSVKDLTFSEGPTWSDLFLCS